MIIITPENLNYEQDDDGIDIGIVLMVPQLDGKVESATKWYTADEVIAIIMEAFGVE